MGSLAIVGSGEYTASMLELETQLIRDGQSRGKSGGYIQCAAAAGLESDQSFNYWKELGRAQAERIGVPWKYLDIRDRRDVENPQWLEAIQGASLIYFSGGSPHHLAQTFHETRLWKAIVGEFASGSSLAGCSAGAMFLGTTIRSFKGPLGKTQPGMNLIPGLQVLPHYDRYFGRIPQPLRSFVEQKNSKSHVIGIDENTALYFNGTEWQHYGRGRVLDLSSSPTQIFTDADKVPDLQIVI